MRGGATSPCKTMVTRHALPPLRRYVSHHPWRPSRAGPLSHAESLGTLRSCKDLNSLLQIHARLVISGVAFTASVSTHLINLYSSFQRCDFSRSIFDAADSPPVILWNSMIRGYARTNQHGEAIKLYRYMLQKGVELDKYTFTFVLKACAGAANLGEGVLIHKEIIEREMESDVFIGTALIEMYCKMGRFSSAREVFEKIPEKDVVTWNAMISGLSHGPEPSEALEFFRHMQLGGEVKPNFVSLLNLLPAVCKLMDVKMSKSIHGFCCRRDFPSAVSNGLVDLYSKCGYPDEARMIFDRIKWRDDVSWGTMMAGYAYNCKFDEVLELFDLLKSENLKMNKVSAVSSLQATAETMNLKKGIEIHDYAVHQNIDSDIMVANSLMTMYAKCGEIEKTLKLFRNIHGGDVVIWSSVISAFAQSGRPEDAISFWSEMLHEGLKPNNVTIISILPACGELLLVTLGKSLHSYIIRTGMDSDVAVGTSLVSMYAKCKLFTAAMTVFYNMPYKEAVTWNALINGYGQNGDNFHAMQIFSQLRLTGLNPDSRTMIGVLLACSHQCDIRQGTCMHGQIIKCGHELDSHVTNTLIDMYAKCGNVSSAHYLFHKKECSKNEVSWNVLIAGYVQNGLPREAISTFYRMRLEDFKPTPITIANVLPAVSNLAVLKDGMAIHAYTIQMGYHRFTVVGNCLIDMYAKCGRLDFSQRIFEEMEGTDPISWNAMLSAYSVHGAGDRALDIFYRMGKKNVSIDSLSFISILSACRHSGLVDEGRKLFLSMREKYNVEPVMEHYACMVDLLGRAGLIDEAMEFIKLIPGNPDSGVWGALLDACKMHSNVKLAEVAIKHLIRLEKENPAHFVVLSDIYSQSGSWNESGCTRVKMNQTGLKKNPGFSWVPQMQNNQVHVSLVEAGT